MINLALTLLFALITATAGHLVRPLEQDVYNWEALMLNRYGKQDVADGIIGEIEARWKEAHRVDLAISLCSWWNEEGRSQLHSRNTVRADGRQTGRGELWRQDLDARLAWASDSSTSSPRDAPI